MDIQTTSEFIKWGVNGITLILMIIAASRAIKKKNNICLLVAIVGNLLVFYFTKSPLLCWIVSIACIIWASMAKGAKGSDKNEPDLKSSKSSASGGAKKSKIGNVIGLILGIGLVAGPLIGYFRQEASLKDPTTQGVLILFAVIGGFMIVNNIFKLLEGDTSTVAPAAVTAVQASPKAKAESEDNKEKVRCRFCNKLYSSEYNGCPYCKKK